MHLFPGWHRAAVESSSIQPHAIEPPHEGSAELGSQGAVWHQDDCNVGRPLLEGRAFEISSPFLFARNRIEVTAAQRTYDAPHTYRRNSGRSCEELIGCEVSLARPIDVRNS